MKSIRRFQRTLLVVLVGLNILVFSTSLYGNMGTALGYAFLGMLAMGSILLLINYFQSPMSKKNNHRYTATRENE